MRLQFIVPLLFLSLPHALPTQHLVTGVEVARVPLDQFGSVRRVYPNPAISQVQVEAIGPKGGAGSVRIVTPSGRVVRRFRFVGLTPGEYQTLTIDVSGLASGVYFLWYSDSTERFIKAGRRIVVLR